MNRIKELREKKGLSLRELSARVGIPASTLGSYEQTGTGARNPKKENVIKIANFFGVTPLYLTGESTLKDKDGYLTYAKKKAKEGKNIGNDINSLVEQQNILLYELNNEFTKLYDSLTSTITGVTTIPPDEFHLNLNSMLSEIRTADKIVILSAVYSLFALLTEYKMGDEEQNEKEKIITILKQLGITTFHF